MEKKAIFNKNKILKLLFCLIMFFSLKAIPNHNLPIKLAIIVDLIVIVVLDVKIISQIIAKRKKHNYG
jgi:hypothetical protein